MIVFLITAWPGVADAVHFDAAVVTNTEQKLDLGDELADLVLVQGSFSHEDNLRFEVVSGSLPAGVVLNEEDGKFYSTSTDEGQRDASGNFPLVTPAVPNAPGTTQAIIRVTDDATNAPRPHQDYVIFTVTVDPPKSTVGDGDIAENSTITFSPTNFLISSGSATVTLTLRDGGNNPITDASPQASVRIGSVSQMTHEGKGVYTATVTSSQPGTSVVTVDNLPEDVVLQSSRPITFRSSSDDPEPWLEVPSEERIVTHFLGTPAPVAPNITTNLEANEKLAQARVEVVGYVEGDELGFWDGEEFAQSYDANGISAEWKQASGESYFVLDFEGDASYEAYEAALQAVHYRYVGGDNADVPDKLVRVSLVVLDDQWAHDPATGHFYQSVEFPKDQGNKSWEETETLVGYETFYGMQGYLATITSSHENDFITDIVDTNAWIGTFDLSENLSIIVGGEVPRWAWMTGPETGQVFWIGHERSQGGWSGPGQGYTVPGMYSNWNSGEPNRVQTGEGPEAFGTIFGVDPPTNNPNEVGQWNDLPNTFANKQWLDGYVIEYGGMDGDPQVKFFEDVVVRVAGGPVTPFAADPTEVRFGEPVTFTNLSYHTNRNAADDDAADRLAQFAEFTWDYGDGGTWTTTENHPAIHTYAYDKLGVFTVSLTGQETRGTGRRSEEEKQTVTVTADLLGHVLFDGIGANPDFADLDVLLMKDGVEFARAPDGEKGHTYDDGTGQYRFIGLLDGSYEVRVVKRGTDELYVPEDWIVHTPSEAPKQPALILEEPEAMLSEPGTVQGPDIAYGPARAVVRGTVFIDDGRGGGTANDGRRSGGEPGVFGVRLRVWDEETKAMHPVLTDASGRYEAEIAGGAGYVELVLPGGAYKPTGYTSGTGKSSVQLTNFEDDVKAQFADVAPGGMLEGVDFGIVPAFAVDGPAPGAAGAGGLHVHSFVVTPGTRGVIQFDVTTPLGWPYTLYRDHNANGRLDEGDELVEGHFEVEGAGDYRFLLLVRPPASAGDGVMDVAAVAASLTYEDNPQLQETERFYAVTTVRLTRLQLQAEVRNVTQDDPPGGGAYSPTLVGARPGDVVEYRVTYHNVDAATATDVVLHGAVPAGTTLLQDAYGTQRPVHWQPHSGGGAEYPSIGQSLSMHGFFFHIGDVPPGQSGYFTYRVELDD